MSDGATWGYSSIGGKASKALEDASKKGRIILFEKVFPNDHGNAGFHTLEIDHGLGLSNIESIVLNEIREQEFSSKFGIWLFRATEGIAVLEQFILHEETVNRTSPANYDYSFLGGVKQMLEVNAANELLLTGKNKVDYGLQPNTLTLGAIRRQAQNGWLQWMGRMYFYEGSDHQIFAEPNYTL